MIEHSIIHIEDDAAQWQPITSSLATAIGEHLSQMSRPAFSSLRHVPPEVANSYPAHSKITWDNLGTQNVVHYWLINTVGVEEIAEHLKGKVDGLTFVLDVMRKKGDAGLHSALPETLASIQKYVADEETQVRLFTAYSESDDVQFPVKHPILFKKGIETSSLLNFLLMRIGFGRP
jgi:hypothetical protein